MPGCTDSHTDGPGCCSAMGAHSPFDRTFAFAPRPAAAPLFVLFVFPGSVCAANTAADAAPNAGAGTPGDRASTATDRSPTSSYGPPGETPGMAWGTVLAAAGSVVGEGLVG